MESGIDILIHLLASALSGVKPKTKLTCTKWGDVITLAIKQQVVAIALDGYQQLHKEECVGAMDKSLLLKWFSCSVNQESQYTKQLSSSKKLSEFYYANGIMTYVLKGFSIAKCYPIPSHRYSCDLDCFIKTVNTKCDAYEKGNSLMRANDINVDDRYYKHSEFQYENIHVENHRFCCSVKRGKRTKELELYLQGLLNSWTPYYIEDSKLALPPLLFQAIFLLEHANGHFLYEKMSLKSVCDWAMFRKKHREQMSWQEFNHACKRFGLNAFVECLNHLSDYILGEIEFDALSKLEVRVLEDTLKDITPQKTKSEQRIGKALDVLKSSWKFKYFSKSSMMKELSHSIFAYFFENEVKLSNLTNKNN